MSDSLPVPQTGPAPTANPAATPTGANGEPQDNAAAAPFVGLLDAALAMPEDASAWLQPLPSDAANPFAPLPEAGKDLPTPEGLPMAWNGLFLVNDPAGRGEPATASDPELTLATIEGEGSDANTRAYVQLLTAKARFGGEGEGIPVRDGLFAKGLETLTANASAPVNGAEAGAASPRQDVAVMAQAPQLPPAGAERSLPSAGVINVPPQHPQWSHALGERMQWMVGQQLQQAEIRLDPPELGSLDVKVTVNKEHATVHFVTHNPQVRDALEAATPRLREMFAESGLNLGNVNVSQESFQQASHEGGEQQPAARGGNGAGDEPVIEAVGGASLPVRRGQGLLDTYA